MELRYCEKCEQMTNHRITILPLVIVAECLKCEAKKVKENGDEKMVNTWDLWVKEFNNAKKFFNSKGNVHTKSKLKDEWYKSFIKSLNEISDEAHKR